MRLSQIIIIGEIQESRLKHVLSLMLRLNYDRRRVDLVEVATILVGVRCRGTLVSRSWEL